jgi:hypothetical protein
MSTNTNTLPVTIRGRYVCKTHRKWDGFTADDGKPVSAGEAVRIFVLDQSDNLREIKANSIPGLDQLTFGVEIAADCEARPYKGQLTFTAVSVQRTAAAKAA